MLFVFAGTVNVHDRGGFAGSNDFFQWAGFTLLATGSTIVMGDFIAMFAHNAFRSNLVMGFVFPVSRHDIIVTVDDHKGFGKQIDDGFTGGFSDRLAHDVP